MCWPIIYIIIINGTLSLLIDVALEYVIIKGGGGNRIYNKGISTPASGPLDMWGSHSTAAEHSSLQECYIYQCLKGL